MILLSIWKFISVILFPLLFKATSRRTCYFQHEIMLWLLASTLPQGNWNYRSVFCKLVLVGVPGTSPSSTQKSSFSLWSDVEAPGIALPTACFDVLRCCLWFPLARLCFNHSSTLFNSINSDTQECFFYFYATLSYVWWPMTNLSHVLLFGGVLGD